MTWDTETSELVQINGALAPSDSQVYLTLSPTTAESSSPSNLASIYAPNKKPGRALLLSITSATALGSSVITIYDNNLGSVIGTKNINLADIGTIYRIDFTTDLDSGTNEFDGQGTIAIGLLPTNASSSVNFSMIFERSLS